MARYFAQLWAQRQNKWLEQDEVVRGEPLNHTAGNQFERHSINSGDYIYVLTVVNEELYLIGRLQVDKICSQREAQRILGTTNLWKAGQHAIAKRGTEIPMRHNLIVPRKSAEGLSFITQEGPTSLGSIDGRKLQTVRELTEGSAKVLDNLLRN